MRNLTYAETALSVTTIAVAAALAYLTWFAPVLAQIRSDREETRAILVRLASERQRVIEVSAAAEPTPIKPDAARPDMKAHVKRRPLDRPRPRQEDRDLTFDESDDPIEGI